jgi:hypothetical protein
MSDPVFFTAYWSTSGTLARTVLQVANDFNVIPFNVVAASSPDNSFNVYTSAFKAPAAGTYEFSASLSATQQDLSNNDILVWLYVNNVRFFNSARGNRKILAQSSAQAGFSGFLVPLNAGDTVRIGYYFSPSSATLNSAYFTGRLVPTVARQLTAVTSNDFNASNVPSVGSPLPLSVVTFGNSDGAFNPFLNAYIAPASGIYSFSSAATAKSTDNIIATNLEVNGSAVSASTSSSGITAFFTATVVTPQYHLRLSAGDVVTLFYVVSPGNTAFSGAFLSIRQVA